MDVYFNGGENRGSFFGYRYCDSGRDSPYPRPTFGPSVLGPLSMIDFYAGAACALLAVGLISAVALLVTRS